MKKAALTLLMLATFNYLYCAIFKDMTNIERFFQKVYPEPNTGCWLWSGAQHPYGCHGSLNAKYYNGFAWAHRFSYFIHNGDFDRTKLVCHKCDVPWCVNPDHLFLGDYVDNNHDSYKKGRSIRGSKHPSSKVTELQIPEIRRLYSEGILMRELAIKFNIGEGGIYKIIKRMGWRHIQ